jgi:hypothetical protein
MSDEGKIPQPPVPFIGDGSQDAAVIAALNEQHRRQHQAAIQSGEVAPPWVPRPHPVYVHDDSSDAATIVAINEQQRRRSLNAALFSSPPPWVPRPRPVYVADGSQDAATIIAIHEQQRRRWYNAAMFSPPVIPPPPRTTFPFSSRSR